jgi:mono/diheme cytochrome c family protein
MIKQGYLHSMKKTTRVIRTLICLTVLISSYSSAFSQSKETLEAHKRRWDTPAWTDTLKNPYSHVSTAADSGKVIYMKICSVCHGNSGKGDGIAAAGLSVKPANHTADNVQLQTDGSLYYELTNGHAPMPAYKTVLTDKQRWWLICFIRTLNPKSKAGSKAVNK